MAKKKKKKKILLLFCNDIYFAIKYLILQRDFLNILYNKQKKLKITNKIKNKLIFGVKSSLLLAKFENHCLIFSDLNSRLFLLSIFFFKNLLFVSLYQMKRRRKCANYKFLFTSKGQKQKQQKKTRFITAEITISALKRKKQQ